jgi:nucleotide-binding universal stress UspA family protein
MIVERILCPVDFSPSSIGAFEYGRSMARENDGRLTLLHVLETLTAGYRGFGLALFGSTTHTVVRRAPCPVLTARDHRPHETSRGGGA